MSRAQINCLEQAHNRMHAPFSTMSASGLTGVKKDRSPPDPVNEYRIKTMACSIQSFVSDIIERCARIDWSRPSHDPDRVKACYRRRLSATNLDRRVIWIDDPADVWSWDITADRIANATQKANKFMIHHGFPFHFVGSDFETWYPRGWRGRDDMNAVDNSSVELSAQAEWGARNGWLTDVVYRHASTWDIAGTKIVNIWAQAATIGSELMTVYHPAFIGTTGQHAHALPFQNTYNQTLEHCLAASWGLWRHTVSSDVAIALTYLNASRRSPAVDTLLSAYEPMIEAYENGAFAHSILEDTVLILAAPAVWTQGQHLHRAGGPALAWTKTKIYGWDDIVVPESVIMRPSEVTTEMIRATGDPKLRRAMMDACDIG